MAGAVGANPRPNRPLPTPSQPKNQVDKPLAIQGTTGLSRAQSPATLASGAEGWRFEPARAHHRISRL
jgi:hypothetical protein